MPCDTIIAGPNGAGKTSFANAMVEFYRITAIRSPGHFINADEIARQLPEDIEPQVRGVKAARLMIETIDHLANAREYFILETTLASLRYISKLRAWQATGFEVVLYYLRLPNVEASIERVQHRVRSGGHSIPEDVIRRRFDKSLRYFEECYKPIVDEWYLIESRQGGFRFVEECGHG